MQTDQDTVAVAGAVDPLVLAIDVGTSSVRALVYDARGRRVSGWEAHRPYEVTTTPDGGVTIDPEMLAGLTAECIDDLTPHLAMGEKEPKAVAFDTFWHSLMGMTADGEATTPIFTWADTRSAAASSALQRELDERAIHARTGAGLHASYWPARLRWLQESDPETVARTRYWVSFGEFFYLRLFSELRVSYGMASGTGLLDQDRCTWDGELLNLLHLTADQLSPLAEFDQAFTALQPRFARRWPHLHGVPWFLALGDGACNNLGSGGIDEDWAVMMVGTSGAIRLVREVEHVSVPEGLWSYRVDRRRIVQGGALSAGGNVWAWLLQTLQTPGVAELEAALAKFAPDAHGLTVLPFLAGERSPDWNPHAQSAFVGATLNTTPLDIIQASLEGIAYRFGLVYALLCESVAPHRGIIGSGAGLIHSPAWMQMMTDVLAVPVTASATAEASSRGAALLVLESLGALKHLSDAPIPLGQTFNPDAHRTSIYRAAQERQQRLYELLSPPRDA